ncbi:class I SAM-dependent methyltransferase [Halalkalicoccus sp. NIPERK01]|uniref:class I SAM-dependent methyltransferase n=1 Tax=Halalkalicoccus sp. NIPERK01 TaxID=3053469 RepID=UPI00256F50B3|nr:class I SAM-dependent methyltransferase [Halalkalicoccus sp. NIPERK01]MDL5361023.1 class I SAM-dependent methyltransferase [Halalkalicoccus sp. NIPERK01]
MGLSRTLLDRTFGRPTGLLGRFGGHVMARMNAETIERVTALADLDAGDRVLEVGFGPGVGIETLARAVLDGSVAGVDASPEMVEQARRRNAALIEAGRVDLRQGTAEDLPFPDGSFDAAFAFNTMQAWTEPNAGLREIRRVVKPGGQVVVSVTVHAGTPEDPVSMLTDAGFESVRVYERGEDVCFLAAAQSNSPVER